MTKNIFRKWKVIEGVPAEMYLEELYQDCEGLLKLILTDGFENSQKLQITFDGQLLYRNIDEANLLAMEFSHEDKQPGGCTFYTIDNSEYLEWFHWVSCNTNENQEIIHYAIYTGNDCVDILSVSPPDVKWID